MCAYNKEKKIYNFNFILYNFIISIIRDMQCTSKIQNNINDTDRIKNPWSHRFYTNS